MERETRRHVVVALRVALAHHPLCSVFRDDTYRLKGLALCRGCVLAGSAFLLGAALALPLLSLASPPTLIMVGLAFGLPQLGTYLHRGAPLVRAVVKVLGGCGLAFLLVGLVASGWPPWLLVVLLVSLAAAFLALQALRFRSLLGTCRRCPWAADWEHCPGFGGI